VDDGRYISYGFPVITANPEENAINIINVST
jgi:hypothetical protein